MMERSSQHDAPEEVAPVQADPRLSDQLLEARRQRAMARLDLEWELEQPNHYNRFLSGGGGQLPARRQARDHFLFGCILVLIVIVLAMLLGPFVLLLASPAFLFSAVLMTSGMKEYFAWRKYDRALSRYRSQRELILGGNSWKIDAHGLDANGIADPKSQGIETLSAVELSEQLARERYQQELARIDLGWLAEREKYYMVSRYGGSRSLPEGSSIWFSVAALLFGAILPLLGIRGSALFGGELFAMLVIGLGIAGHYQSKKYRSALAAYQARRAALRPEQFRCPNQET